MLSVRKRNTSIARRWRGNKQEQLPDTTHDLRKRRRKPKPRKTHKWRLVMIILSVAGSILLYADPSYAKRAAMHAKIYLDRAWFALERWGWLEEIHGFDTTQYHDRYPRLQLLEENFAVIKDELTAVLASQLDQIPVAAKIHNYKSPNFQYEKTPWKEREF